MRRLFLVALLALLVVPLAGADKYSPSASVSPSTVAAGEFFDVSGCGYAAYGDSEFGNVVVGFTGGSWGSPLDSNGCFTITDIPALSGDTLPAGDYPVTVYQYVHGPKLKRVAEATLTVVP